MQKDSETLQNVAAEWGGISQEELVSTAQRFFQGYNHFRDEAADLSHTIIQLQLSNLLLDPKKQLLVIRSEAENPTLCISDVPNFADRLKAANKGIVYVGTSWIYGLLGDAKLFTVDEIEPALAAIAKELAEAAAAKKAKDAEKEKEKEKKKAAAASASSSSSSSSAETPAPVAVAAAGAAPAASSGAAPKQLKITKATSVTVSKGKTKEGKKQSAKVDSVSQFTVFGVQTSLQDKVVEFFSKKGFVVFGSEE